MNWAMGMNAKISMKIQPQDEFKRFARIRMQKAHLGDDENICSLIGNQCNGSHKCYIESAITIVEDNSKVRSILHISKHKVPQNFTIVSESDVTLFNRNVTISEMYLVLEAITAAFTISSLSLASSKWKSS